MAVTLGVSELAQAIRVGDTTEETAQVTRLLAYATQAVARYLGAAYAATPEVVVNEGAIRLAAYMYDQPNAGRGLTFSDALRNSGAAAVLLPYRIHRAGLIGGDPTAPAAPPPLAPAPATY